MVLFGTRWVVEIYGRWVREPATSAFDTGFIFCPALTKRTSLLPLLGG